MVKVEVLFFDEHFFVKYTSNDKIRESSRLCLNKRKIWKLSEPTNAIFYVRILITGDWKCFALQIDLFVSVWKSDAMFNLSMSWPTILFTNRSAATNLQEQLTNPCWRMSIVWLVQCRIFFLIAEPSLD